MTQLVECWGVVAVEAERITTPTNESTHGKFCIFRVLRPSDLQMHGTNACAGKYENIARFSVRELNRTSKVQTSVVKWLREAGAKCRQ